MAKNTNKKLIYIYVSVLLVLIMLIALAIIRPWAEKDESKFSLKVGFLPIYVDLPLFVAKDKGFFEKRGLDVKLIPFQSSPEIGTALVTNNIDAGASIATSSALVIESRDPGKFKVFLVDAENPKNYLSSLVVLESSGIENVKDLTNKEIVSFPGPTFSLFGPLALKKLGLNTGDYRIFELPIGEHISALTSRNADALITYEPIATQAVVHHGAKKLIPGLIETHVISPWQAGIWIISTKAIRENKESVEKFIAGIYEAVDFIRTSPDTAKESLTKYTSIDLDIAKKTPNIPFTKTMQNEVDLKTLQEHFDLLHEKGIIRNKINAKSLMINNP